MCLYKMYIHVKAFETAEKLESSFYRKQEVRIAVNMANVNLQTDFWKFNFLRFVVSCIIHGGEWTTAQAPGIQHK